MYQQIAREMGFKIRSESNNFFYLCFPAGCVELQVACQESKEKEKIVLDIYDDIITIADLELPNSFANIFKKELGSLNGPLERTLDFKTLSKKDNSPVNPANYLLSDSEDKYQKEVFIPGCVIHGFLSKLNQLNSFTLEHQKA